MDGSLVYDKIESGKNHNFGKSLRTLKWHLIEADERLVASLAQRLSIDEVLAKVMVNRGIVNIEQAINFLEPKLRNILPNPFILKGMEEASSRIIEAILNNEKVTIFADYDVDGATSAALLMRFFKMVNLKVNVYVPNRLTEGYGPNINALEKIKAGGSSLVITVDCGTVSFEPLKVAKDIGLDVIVIDHHLTVESLPEAIAIVNPNRFDDDFPYKAIAAVGVAFMVTIAIRKKLRDIKWFENNNTEEFDLFSLLDLVALGTVCDVMPLNDINRAFVFNGLKLIAKRQNVGISSLIDLLKLETKLHSYHLGYVIGPRINAGGRVSEGNLGVSLLTTDSHSEAYSIANKLEGLNNERKALESLALEEAVSQIESQELYKNSIIIVVGNSWHIGILGILASRIKELYHKPAIAISINNFEIGKGSARSINGLDLGKAIVKAKSVGLLIEGGGHAMAGGLTISSQKIESFYNFLLNEFKPSNNQHFFDKVKELPIDSVLSIGAANVELLNQLSKAGPFGQGNPQPRFVFTNVIVVRSMIVGNKHVVAFITDNYNKYITKQNKFDLPFKRVIKSIAFRWAENELGKFLLNNIGTPINVAGILQVSNIDNNKVELIIDDIAV